MNNIRLYGNKAAYDADTASRASVAGSVVSAVLSAAQMYDGKNIIVPLSGAEVADIVVYDKIDLKHKIVKKHTYHNSSFLSTRFIIGGVVYAVAGNNVMVMAKSKLSNARYAQGYKVKLAGLNFTTGGTFKITLSDRESVSGTIAFTSSDTLATVSAAINALGHARFSAVAHTTHDCVTIEHNDYSTPAVTLSDVSAGITISELAAKYQTTYADTLLANGVIKPATILRNKGLTTSYAGANFLKFKQYYAASGLTTAGLSTNSAEILRQSSFNATDNPVLFSKYAGDYDAYVLSEMLSWPTGRGVMRQFNSREMTCALAAKTWTDVDGSAKPAYPSAALHLTYGITTEGYITGFEPGCWHCGSVFEMYLMMKDRSLAGDDALNLTIAAIGGTKHLTSDYYWTCCEYGSSNGWYYIGYNGGMGAYNKYNSYSGRPVLALKY